MRKRNKPQRSGVRGVKFSIVFKTSAIYTSMFTLILVLTVGLLTWAMATQSARAQRLDKLTSFLAERYTHGEDNFDFASFAQANHVYIELMDPVGGKLASYGTAPDPG